MKNVYEGSLQFDKNGIASEAMLQAEMDYESISNYEELVSEGIIDSGHINKMAYKHDDGYWRVTGYDEKFNSYDDLVQKFGDI